MNEQEKLIEECLLSGEEIDAIEEEIAKDPMKELYIGRGHCGVIYDALLKAQLEKVKGYVQQQVEAAKKKEVTAKDGTKYRNIGAYIDSGT